MPRPVIARCVTFLNDELGHADYYLPVIKVLLACQRNGW